MTGTFTALQRLGAGLTHCDGCGRVIRKDTAEYVMRCIHTPVGSLVADSGPRTLICDASDACYELIRKRHPDLHFQRFYKFKPGDKVHIL